MKSDIKHRIRFLKQKVSLILTIFNMNEKSVRSLYQPVDKENVKFTTANKRKNAKMYVQVHNNNKQS